MPFYECDIRVTFCARDANEAAEIADAVAANATNDNNETFSVLAHAGDVHLNSNQPTKAELMNTV